MNGTATMNATNATSPTPRPSPSPAAPSAAITTVWFVGVVLFLMSSVLTTLSLNLQKWSYNRNSMLPREERRPVYVGAHVHSSARPCLHSSARPCLPALTHYTCVPRYRQVSWGVGAALMLTQGGLDFLALAFAPVTKLACIGAATVLFNSVVAPGVLGERLSVLDVMATVLVLTGAVVAIVFSPYDTPTYSLQELLERTSNPITVLYIGIVTLVLLVSLSSHAYLMRLKCAADAQEARELQRVRLWQTKEELAHTRAALSRGSNDSEELAAATAGYGGAGGDKGGQELQQLAPVAPPDDPDDPDAPGLVRDPYFALASLQYPAWMRTFHSLLLPIAGGMGGGMTVLFAKSLVELTKTSVVSAEQMFYRGETYFLLFCIVVSCCTQVFFLNCSLAQFDALHTITWYQSSWMIVSVLDGVICFGDFERETWVSTIVFTFAMSFVIAGVMLLNSSRRLVQTGFADDESLSMGSSLSGHDEGERLDEIIEMWDIDRITSEWSDTHIRTRVAYEKATSTRMREDIAEKDQRIRILQLQLASIKQDAEPREATSPVSHSLDL